MSRRTLLEGTQVSDMAWHVLSSTYFDFDRFARESKADSLPHHLLPQIAERLDAEVHQPDDAEPSAVDRLGAVVYAGPEHWRLARRVYGVLGDGDSVYTAGCDSGIPLALLCGLRRRPISFAIAFADPTRRRSRMLIEVLLRLSVRLTAIVTTEDQERKVREAFGDRLAAVHAIEGQTDCNFFRPPDESAHNEPAVVAGCGVEQRDYVTMAAALEGLPIAATVCFVSPNRTSKTRFTMPDPVPANMDFRHLEFLELRRLYQEADLVVLPLLENRYSAGLTTLFEAIACGAPVVVTASPGTIQTLIDDELVLGVPVGDPTAMQAAVRRILDDKPAAARRSAAARARILERFSAASFLDRLERVLTEHAYPVTQT